ncbi:CAP domain-containing protein [Myxococcaceae bacterium GXIMD 01537]
MAKLSDFQREVLEAHNEVRAGMQPAPAQALPALTWSPRAEQTAKEWAERCSFEHNAERGHLGENLAAATPNTWTTHQMVKEAWASEVEDYDYAANTCAEGKVCGHYTQLVWRATTGVGCAVKTCTTNSPFGARFPTWQFWVCNYTPPGNVEGQKPY